MTDLYKLEWIHSIKTIQTGMSQSLNRDSFMDTIMVCHDGVVTHNKLVLGLIFPELCQIPVFDQPLEQTLIMPDWKVAEVQSLIFQLFPDSDLTPDGLKEDDIETSVSDNFEHFLETDTIIQDSLDSSPRAFGMRRGRGRPRAPAGFERICLKSNTEQKTTWPDVSSSCTNWKMEGFMNS